MLVTSNAVFYDESDTPLLDYFGVYGGYYFYLNSTDVAEFYENDGYLVVWVPDNYKDYFSSDSNALVNTTSSTITLRAMDGWYNPHTVRFQGYGYMQLRSDYTPYTYHNVTSMDLIDTNIHVKGKNSPFFNSNPYWDSNTKLICMSLGLCTLALILVGVFNGKSRSY